MSAGNARTTPLATTLGQATKDSGGMASTLGKRGSEYLSSPEQRLYEARRKPVELLGQIGSSQRLQFITPSTNPQWTRRRSPAPTLRLSPGQESLPSPNLTIQPPVERRNQAIKRQRANPPIIRRTNADPNSLVPARLRDSSEESEEIWKHIELHGLWNQ